MMIDRNSIGYRLLAPIFLIVTVITVSLLVLVQRISGDIQQDYRRFSISNSSSSIAHILDSAATELTSAVLLGNPAVVDAKKQSVLDAIRLAWSRSELDGVVVGPGGLVLVTTLSQDLTRSLLAHQHDGYFIVHAGGGQYDVNSLSFAPWQWTVMTVSRQSRSYFSVPKAALLVPLVAGGSLLMAAGLFLVLRRNLQRPVTSMVSAVAQGRSVDATMVTEFDRIGEAVNEALRRVRERTVELERELEERMKAEAATAAKEAQIHLLLDSTAEGIYGVDQRGICTFCNPSCLRMLGYEREEDLLGKNIHSLAHHTRPDGSVYPDGECRIYQAYRQKTGVHADDEVFWRSDGSCFPIEYWSHPVIEQGVVTGAVVTFIDITERRQQESFIRDILETVDEGFLVIDRNYTIRNANRALTRMVGMPLEEINDRPCYEVLHRCSRPCHEDGGPCSVRSVLETGIPCTTVHTHHSASGAEIKVESKTYPMRGATGTSESVIMTIMDITEKSGLEQQLRQAQKMEAVGQLAGGIAHDFNNILTAIVGYASVLKLRTEAGGALHSYADQILISAQKAANLTRQILAFSRKQVISPRPINLNETILSIEKIISRIIGEEIAVKTVLADHDVTVMADAGQIEQVLMNLATNARDAMPTGGNLLISTEIVSLDRRESSVFDLERPGRYAVLSVSDTGVGMDEGVRQRIFEPFFTTKEMGKGTGLGLSIVYGIIKQHHGQVVVQSEPARGTTFKIYLPLTETQADQRRELTDTGSLGGNETVLIAEDNEDVRLFLSQVLREYGYQVITATDGIDAVAKFQEQRNAVKLCLLDVIMPRKNGNEALAEIRGLHPDIKALFMSGYAADVLGEKEVIGTDTILLGKPLMPQELLRRVREALDG